MQKSSTLTIMSVIAATLTLGQLGMSQEAFAMKQITLEDLGVLQLAAHDLFDVDRMDGDPGTGIDNENGLLDLSTLLDHGHSNIAFGGEFRNAENIMIFTVSSELGAMYLSLESSIGPQLAREQTVEAFQNMFKQSYLNAFDEQAPDPYYGCVTMTENLAFRTVHDFLPQEIVHDFGDGNGPVTVSIFDLSLFGRTLSPSERIALSSPLDGAFDPIFTVDTLIPPPVNKVVNLFQADSTFAGQFFTERTFEYFLAELEPEPPSTNGKYDTNDEVLIQIRNLIAKGLGSGCTVAGEILPIEASSLMLAGAYSTASWLIPVFVSASGIGFILIRKKI
jgi:hypothetical protein